MESLCTSAPKSSFPIRHGGVMLHMVSSKNFTTGVSVLEILRNSASGVPAHGILRKSANGVSAYRIFRNSARGFSAHKILKNSAIGVFAPFVYKKTYFHIIRPEDYCRAWDPQKLLYLSISAREPQKLHYWIFGAPCAKSLLRSKMLICSDRIL